MANASERRCSAETKRGQCRVTRGLNGDGLCSMHSGKVDPKQLGRASARARGRPKADRVHPSLREYLRREVAPAEVWAAIKAALEGSSEAARVSASRLLVDALHEGEQDRNRELQVQDAAAEFDRTMAERVARIRVIRQAERAGILEPLGLVDLADQDDEQLVAELARRLAAIPAAVRSEHTIA